MKKSYVALLSTIVIGIVFVLRSSAVFATDGMNLEGYGPIAAGMGGASMAYDNGTAALMNNPATLGLMPEGDTLDVALGYLGPHVKASTPGMDEASSSSTAFIMPAIGWIKRTGPYAYGVGVFAQGGMGTEYGAESFMAAGSGEKARSELGVGRLLIPFAYNVDKNLTVAATVDYVWAGLDLKMALSGAQFGDMVAGLGGTQSAGTAAGSMVDTLTGAFTVPQAMCGNVPCLAALNWARFDFNDSSPFTEKAMGTGFAGKVGGVYKVNDAVSVGATYHSKTYLGDMTAKGAALSMNVVGPATMNQAVTIPVTGQLKVKDFQWPQTVGAGVSYQATPALQLVFDYKWINWAAVMKSFKMSFTADSTQTDAMATNFGLGGQSMDAELFQKWKDQNVFEIGAGYKVNTELTLRVGLNIANNPIPDTYMNALFPAIERNHVTIGAGYMIGKASSVDASFTLAPEVSQTTQVMTAAGPAPVTVKHSQTNVQVMYSYRF
jgi:long-chain fatty acid transport protein